MQHLAFRQVLEIEYQDLEGYFQSSLSALRRSEEERMQSYESLPKALSQDKDAIQFFAHAGPFLLKHALFISAYSFMEYSLKKFCEIASAELKMHQRRVSEFEKVYQYYFFLINDLKISKEKLEDDWDKLNIFRDLRNSMVHYNSTIGKNISAKTYDFITTDSRIQFEEPRAFYIKDEALIMEVLKVSRRFLVSLMEEYERSYFPPSK